MRSRRRELIALVAAVLAYASCRASSEPAYPTPPVAAPGGGADSGGDAASDVSSDGYDAWAYESSIPDEPAAAPQGDAKKEPLPSWWSGGGTDSKRPSPGGDGGHPVSVVVEVVEVNGTVSSDAVRSQIAGNHGRVESCYVSAIARDPESKGTLRARFIVGTNGRVVQAARGAGDLHDPRLVQCLLRVHEGIQFPPAGAPYTVSISIKLEQTS